MKWYEVVWRGGGWADGERFELTTVGTDAAPLAGLFAAGRLAGLLAAGRFCLLSGAALEVKEINMPPVYDGSPERR